ncbi:NADP oxidoreductase [Amycolatopsis acidicola]|uniref:ferredoxin--NADP(+) reductase n=1 Tax=Amycolatopsis acidicola TaxID=2596893 RepID=A0A5N0V880_9PSEU|nr:FAD-dependent oxidoreductase [Amycolatopsis acidicola]KAA9162609.1 NADP oxidoreductase [Amycolatopsis acidicola]
MPHVAVVGAGPSGVFATAELLRRPDVRVDVFDRGPTPYGLVRYGVAPDHLKIKSVTRALARTLTDPRVTFRGNVELGRDVRLPELRREYQAVVLATGAPHARRLGIPGEDLPSHVPAAEVVRWYNGFPGARDLSGLLRGPVVVIGAGNVALDVARVLVKGHKGLSHTDVPPDVLAALTPRDVRVMVRRGVADAKFSPVELLEVGKLPGVDLVVEGLDPEADGEARSAGIFREWAERPRSGGGVTLTFGFHQAPIAVRDNGVALPDRTIPAGLVVSAIGYTGERLDGVPFDDSRGLIPNTRGRVAPGLFVTGWAKRGPSGVIGTNKACAAETVAEVLGDLTDGPVFDIEPLLAARGCRWVPWPGWTRIDEAEVALGRANGRERTKITDLARLLDLGAPSENLEVA